MTLCHCPRASLIGSRPCINHHQHPGPPQTTQAVGKPMVRAGKTQESETRNKFKVLEAAATIDNESTTAPGANFAPSTAAVISKRTRSTSPTCVWKKATTTSAEESRYLHISHDTGNREEPGRLQLFPADNDISPRMWRQVPVV